MYLYEEIDCLCGVKRKIAKIENETVQLLPQPMLSPPDNPAVWVLKRICSFPIFPLGVYLFYILGFFLLLLIMIIGGPLYLFGFTFISDMVDATSEFFEMLMIVSREWAQALTGITVEGTVLRWLFSGVVMSIPVWIIFTAFSLITYLKRKTEYRTNPEKLEEENRKRKEQNVALMVKKDELLQEQRRLQQQFISTCHRLGLPQTLSEWELSALLEVAKRYPTAPVNMVLMVWEQEKAAQRAREETEKRMQDLKEEMKKNSDKIERAIRQGSSDISKSVDGVAQIQQAELQRLYAIHEKQQAELREMSKKLN